jgi:hypothetical protein
MAPSYQLVAVQEARFAERAGPGLTSKGRYSGNCLIHPAPGHEKATSRRLIVSPHWDLILAPRRGLEPGDLLINSIFRRRGRASWEYATGP